MAVNPYAYGRLNDVIDQAIADAAAYLTGLDATMVAARTAGFPGQVIVSATGADSQTVAYRTTPDLGADYSKWLAAIMAAGDAALLTIE